MSANKDHFLLYNGLINLNHGSFGTVPKVVVEKHFQYILEQESCPEIWFRETYFNYINESRRLIADLVHANVNDIVLVENASYGVNSVLRSFPFEAGDKVVFFSCVYKMVIDTLEFLVRSAGIELVMIPLQYPLRDAEYLVETLTATLQSVGPVKMCVLDHISSMPSMVTPIHALTAVAKAHKSLVLIDGAHAPGAVDIDVEAIGADYYTGNCHKWLFAPKGTAFLWVAPSAQTAVCPQPVVISSSGKYDFVGRFEYTGTRDYTPFCAIPTALSFVDEVLGGLAAVQRFNRELVVEASRLLIDEWNTGYLVPEEMVGFMACVILPCTDPDVLARMQTHLFKTYQLSFVYGHVITDVDVSPSGKFHGADFVNVTAENTGSSESVEAGATTVFTGATQLATATAALSLSGNNSNNTANISNGSNSSSNNTNPLQHTIYFVRISAQVYLTLSDFELFSRKVKEYLATHHIRS